jgi:hypothetical protein
MVELLITAAFVLVPLFLAIPLLGKYLDMRTAAVQTARYAAWERTVWYGGGAGQANEKSDDEIRSELGARLLSETAATDAFSKDDRSASGFKGGSKMLWKDRTGKALLASYDDIGGGIANQVAPGTVNAILTPIAALAAKLGPFVLETKGEYAATVQVNIKDIDYVHYLAKDSSVTFSETNVLLANGWSASGPDDSTHTGVKQQVRGLVPTSLFDNDVVTDILTIGGLALPELGKLELGKIEPDAIPADRKK